MPHVSLRARRPLLAAAVAGLAACAPAARHVAAPAPSPAPAPAPTVASAPTPVAAAGPSAPRPSAPAARADVAKAGAATESAGAVDRGAHWHTPGTTFDLDVHDFETQDRVTRYVRLFSGPARASFTEQLERGTRYEAMIRGRLRAAGLPEDMYYLALVESGFDPQATSRVNAVGMWQFMAATARDVGLRVDWWVDERRDPMRATDAAIRTMRWLRSQFGSMFLAAAAYNGGEGRVSRGLAQLAAGDSARADSARADSARADSVRLLALDAESAEAGPLDATEPVQAGGPSGATPTGDGRFFALASAGYLRSETMNYVPQLIAAALVAKEPARYGIVVRPQRVFAYDSVRVGALVPLAAVATAADATRGQMLELNPHLLRGITPPGAATYVRVPEGTGAATARRLDDATPSELRAFRRVTTKKRDSYAAIAEREDVPARLVARFNPSLETVRSGKWKGRIVSGQAVRLPTRAVLAYMRDVPEMDAPSLASLPMPAAPNGEAKAGTVAKGEKATAERPAKSDKAASAKTRRAEATEKRVAKSSAKASAKPSAKAEKKSGASHRSAKKRAAAPSAKKKAPTPKGRRSHD